MADDTYNFIVAAKDNASATLKRVSGELNTMGGAAAKPVGPLQRLSSVTGGLVTPLTLGIGAAAALTVGLFSAADAAREDETSVALLSQALRANAKDFTGNTDAIEATIRARMALGFADEEQRESLRQLVAVTKDSSEALKLQRTAMDLARLKNIDLNTASTLLGKVYAGNIGILSRYGIQLEKGTTATEAIAEIQARAAGQAETWAESSEGAAAAAGIALSELAETAGRIVLPVITALAKAITDLSYWILDMVDAVGDAVDWLSQFSNAAEKAASEADRFAQKGEAAGLKVGRTFEKVPEQIPDLGPQLERSFTSPMAAAMRDVRETASREMGKVPSDMSSALTNSLPDLNDGLDALKDMIKNGLSDSKKIAQLEGILSSKALARGLRDERYDVRAAARQLQQDTRRELREIRSGAADAAADGGDAFAEWLRRKRAPAIEQARATASQVTRALEFDAAGAGQSVAQSYIDGLAGAINSSHSVTQVQAAIYAMKARTIGNSPPVAGPLAPARLLEAARSVGKAYTGALAGEIGRGMRLPALSGGSLRGRGGNFGFGGGGGLTLVIQSMSPPTPAQAQEFARHFGPELERWRQRNGR